MTVPIRRHELPPWDRNLPDGPWDYIVIGSGMGGMTSAALLSKLGKRVLVLEQHYEPGGFTHTFKRKRWKWDVGVQPRWRVGGTARGVGEVSHPPLDGPLEGRAGRRISRRA